jgi:phosphoglycerate dehydrogenase-like enzyme
MSVRVAIGPRDVPGLADALTQAGGEIVPPDAADAIVWTSPEGADELGAILLPRHRWVALVIAGVERWLASGVVDDARIWTCARGVYADGVAEHGVALILADARRLPTYARHRAWEHAGGERLRGATVTVLGAGAIGRRLAELLGPMGAQLVAITRRGVPVAGFAETRRADDLPGAIRGTRYLVVAAPLTAATRAIVDAPVLDELGPRGAIVNLSRGELVDTDALVERLGDGRVGAALLDVTDPEPLPPDHPLWSLDNVLITPHVANPNTGNPWDSHVPELVDHLASNLRAFAAGTPLDGTIDLDDGY